MNIQNEKDLEKFSFELLESIKKSNPFKRTYYTIMNLSKWVFVVFAGTLIWAIDYIDYYHNKIFYFKPLLFLIIMYFAFATIFTIISIIFLYKREFNYGYAYDRIEKFDHFIDPLIKRENDFKKIKTKIDEYSDFTLALMHKGDKLILFALSLIYISAILYTTALLTLLYYYFFIQI